MEEFKVLDICNVTKHWSKNGLEIKIQYQNELILFYYSLNSEQQWTYRDAFFSENIHQVNMFYHFKKLDQINKDKTWGNFYETTKKLAPKILDHPKVRIKAILNK